MNIRFCPHPVYLLFGTQPRIINPQLQHPFDKPVKLIYNALVHIIHMNHMNDYYI